MYIYIYVCIYIFVCVYIYTHIEGVYISSLCQRMKCSYSPRFRHFIFALNRYTKDAPELQLRRLGDLAFLFQMYEFAYNTYHAAKKDFNNDHAWLHFAGSLVSVCIKVFYQSFLCCTLASSAVSREQRVHKDLNVSIGSF